MVEIVLKRNESFLVRSGDVVFRISDWGDAIQGGGRGYLVVEEATRYPRRLRAESVGYPTGEFEYTFGVAICVGLADED